MFNKEKRVTRLFRAVTIQVLSVLLLTGCNDSIGGNDSESSTISLSIHVPSVASGIGAKGGSGILLTDGVNTLNIESVGIVLREIELERQFDLDCDELDNQGSNHDICEKFESGPILLQPALDGSLSHVVTIEISEGVYDELEFDVHKLSDDSAENRALLNLHPEFDDLSIRVQGTYNGEDFVFTQDLMDEQEIDLNPPLTITGESEVLNVTMDIDLATWFVDDNSNLVNPASANKGGEYEGIVERNIKDSIDAFEDDDEDGEKDNN